MKIFEKINGTFLHDEKKIDLFNIYNKGKPRPYKSKLSDASVLILFIENKILLTQRSDFTKTHAGQISFPGGKRSDIDNSPKDTALRECFEETGIEIENIDVFASMPTYIGGQGFKIAPFIASCNSQISITPCPREVKDYFLLDFSYLNAKNFYISEFEINNYKFNMPCIDYDKYHIWGLTAGILWDVHKLLHD